MEIPGKKDNKCSGLSGEMSLLQGAKNNDIKTGAYVKEGQAGSRGQRRLAAVRRARGLGAGRVRVGKLNLRACGPVVCCRGGR